MASKCRALAGGAGGSAGGGALLGRAQRGVEEEASAPAAPLPDQLGALASGINSLFAQARREGAPRAAAAAPAPAAEERNRGKVADFRRKTPAGAAARPAVRRERGPSPAQVDAALEAWGLKRRFAAVLREQELHGEVLASVTEDDLASLPGVRDPADRAALLGAIRQACGLPSAPPGAGAADAPPQPQPPAERPPPRVPGAGADAEGARGSEVSRWLEEKGFPAAVRESFEANYIRGPRAPTCHVPPRPASKPTTSAVRRRARPPAT